MTDCLPLQLPGDLFDRMRDRHFRSERTTTTTKNNISLALTSINAPSSITSLSMLVRNRRGEPVRRDEQETEASRSKETVGSLGKSMFNIPR